MLNDELDTAILALLAGGETRSEALAAALGRPVRTIKYRLGRLRDADLVESQAHGVWHLTAAGNLAALVGTVPEPVAASEALAALPTQHQAILHLIEDAVVARRALEAIHPASWPGFVLVGPVQTGKTLIGLLAARRFGLDPAAAIITLRLESPGSLLGQRVQDSGGAWRTEPSRLLALPLVVIDEYDKVGLELRRAAFTYLAGTHRRSPGDALAVHPTTIITLNLEGDPGALLPDSVLRRSVVLDTSGLLEATADLDRVEWDLVLAGLAPVAADLTPPAADLPETARSLLRAILRSCLTARGWALVDSPSISRLALGRWATMPTTPEAAVRAVAADFLTVAATRPGLVEPDWPVRFEAQAGVVDAPIAATLAAARERQAAGEAHQVSAERASLTASLELAGTRARLLDALDHALKSAPRAELNPQERATIAAARGKGRLLRTRLVEARILDALSALEPVVEREVLDPIGTVAAAREARRQQAELERQRRQEDDREARRRAHEAAHLAEATRQAAQRAAKTRRAAVEALCRRTTTRPRGERHRRAPRRRLPDPPRRTARGGDDRLDRRQLVPRPGRPRAPCTGQAAAARGRRSLGARSPGALLAGSLPTGGGGSSAERTHAPLQDGDLDVVRGPRRPAVLRERPRRLGERRGPGGPRSGGRGRGSAEIELAQAAGEDVGRAGRPSVWAVGVTMGAIVPMTPGLRDGGRVRPVPDRLSGRRSSIGSATLGLLLAADDREQPASGEGS